MLNCMHLFFCTRCKLIIKSPIGRINKLYCMVGWFVLVDNDLFCCCVYYYHHHHQKKVIKVKIFITKPQLKSHLQSTCCYKKSN